MPLKLDVISRGPHLPALVASSLSREIAEGRLKPGDQLPTEQALAKTFGVSRNVVREAIARLRSENRVWFETGAWRLRRRRRQIASSCDHAGRSARGRGFCEPVRAARLDRGSGRGPCGREARRQRLKGDAQVLLGNGVCSLRQRRVVEGGP